MKRTYATAFVCPAAALLPISMALPYPELDMAPKAHATGSVETWWQK